MKTRSHSSHSAKAAKSLAMAFATAGTLFTCQSIHAAIFTGDLANYAVLFEGGGNNHLNINNGTINGNVGVGAPSGSTTAQSQLNNPLTINGNLNFAGAVNNAQGSGVVINGTVNANVSAVQTDLNNLNTLSTTLGGESGTSLGISIGNGGTQTVNASSGVLDGSGNRVFTVSSLAFVNGATLQINGDGAGDSVVFNINFDASFGGTIALGGGLTPDDVLFNVLGGANLTGGHALTISTSGATEAGVFLDPNGSMSINHSVLNGRFFGGDSHDDAIVSGITISAPVPEPSMAALIAMGFAGLFIVKRQRRS